MQSQALLNQNQEELDLILEEESSLLTTKQRKKLNRQRKTKQTNNNNVENIDSYRSNTRKRLEAKTDRQQQLINTIIGKEQTIVIGSAGTGKTFVTAAMAAQMLKENKGIEKIILTRPNVPTGRSIGFFPGSLEEKMEPWVFPVVNVFKQFMNPKIVDDAMKNGKIEVVPFEVIRGRSFEKAFIILDEAQNTSEDEMKAFVTRVGEGSKIVIDGDVSQSDIGKSNGLKWVMNQIRTNKYLKQNVGFVEFTSDDIVRSDLCKAWVKSIEKKDRTW